MNRVVHRRTLGVVLTVAVLCGCSSGDDAEVPTEGEQVVQDAVTSDSAQSIPVLRPEVLAEVPHDPSAFTQGLELHEGTLYEGTGLEGQSQLRVLDPVTGEVLRAESLPGQLFGEGIAVAGDRIWQLTWQDRKSTRLNSSHANISYAVFC